MLHCLRLRGNLLERNALRRTKAHAKRHCAFLAVLVVRYFIPLRLYLRLARCGIENPPRRSVHGRPTNANRATGCFFCEFENGTGFLKYWKDQIYYYLRKETTMRNIDFRLQRLPLARVAAILRRFIMRQVCLL